MGSFKALVERRPVHLLWLVFLFAYVALLRNCNMAIPVEASSLGKPSSGLSIITNGLGKFCLPTCVGMQSPGVATVSKVPIYFQFELLNTTKFATAVGVPAVTAALCGGLDCGMAGALFDSSCTVLAGGSLTTSTDTTVNVSIAYPFAAAIILPPGIYYWGFVSDSSFLSYYGAADNSGFSQALNQDGANVRWFTGANMATGDNATLTMPNACGARTPLSLEVVPTWLFYP